MSAPGTPSLFDPHVMRGGVSLANRVVMAPMTRSRAEEPGDLPSRFAPAYYQQRAEAGLIITEGTTVSRVGKGYSLTPGIYSAEQVVRWCAVADAVHEVEASVIFMQLWHVGRISSEAISGSQPLAPSAVQSPTATVWFQRDDGWQGNIPCSPPRAMTAADIDDTITEFADAARRALSAGMDGVELHAANGYLFDQFLREPTNRRSDAYGGPPENRIRFLTETAEAVAAVAGAHRIGVRLSPDVDYGDTQDPSILETTLLAADALDRIGVAYIHLVESNNANFLSSGERNSLVDEEFKQELRRRFHGTIIAAHEYDAVRAHEVLRSGRADAVAFGRPFIANPDLVQRLRAGAELAPSDRDTWYGGGEAGYTDYPRIPAPSHA